MKKIFLLLIMLFVICSLLVVCLSSFGFMVKYQAGEGGSVKYFSASNEIAAVPDSGYRFVAWSDGATESIRAFDRYDKTKVTAIFEPMQVVYCDGGTVEETETGVRANANNGYRFVGWTDGTQLVERNDSVALTETASVEAIFEPVQIEMYAGEQMIKSVAVEEFVSMSEKDLFVSVRGKFFQNWKLRNSPIPLDSTDDVVNQIKLSYVKGETKDISDIELDANFTDSKVKEFYAFRTIAHALGGASWLETDNKYLNSLEVFEYYYEMGQRFFEIDLLLTKDGKTVAAHEYESEMLYDDFMATKREGFTPIDLEMLVDLMIQYPEVRMDLDILGVYRSGYEGSLDEKLTLFYDALDEEIRCRDAGDGVLYEDIYNRFVLEIFLDSPGSSKMLDLAKQEKYGFRHYLYLGVGDQETPMGTTMEDLEAICQWCVANDIQMMSTKILDEEFIAMTDRYDIFTFAYTYNSLPKIQELLSIGIDCVFTDFIYF